VGFLKDFWDEISFEMEYPDNEEGRLNSWICFWLLPSFKKIRARTKDGFIFVATSDKANRLKLKYRNLEILNKVWPFKNSP